MVDATREHLVESRKREDATIGLCRAADDACWPADDKGQLHP